MEGRGMETQEGRVLKRGLKRRHLTMIAIGGSIGTGLFLAMGGTIKDAEMCIRDSPWRQRRLSDGWESVQSKRDGAAKDAQ